MTTVEVNDEWGAMVEDQAMHRYIVSFCGQQWGSVSYLAEGPGQKFNWRTHTVDYATVFADHDATVDLVKDLLLNDRSFSGLRASILLVDPDKTYKMVTVL